MGGILLQCRKIDTLFIFYCFSTNLIPIFNKNDENVDILVIIIVTYFTVHYLLLGAIVVVIVYVW